MASQFNPDSTDLDRIHGAVKREKADLPAGSESAPTWAIFFALLVAVFAGAQISTTSGGYSLDNVAAYGPLVDNRPQDGDPNANLDPLQLAMKKGASAYNTCQGCHMADGKGQPGLYPPLAGSDFVTGGTERLIRIPQHGITGPVTVAGQTFNFPGGMAGLGATLSDQDYAYLMTFIRNSWGNKGSVVTKEMVAKVRGDEKGRTAQWTASELEKYADKNVPGADAPPAK